MGLFAAIADHRNPRSLAAGLRRRRFAMLSRLLARVPRPLRILDVGGTQGYWDAVAPDGLDGAHIVLLNQQAPAVTRPGFEGRAGDARAMPQFADGSFDLVFTNSVIEHVGSRDDQHRMADEIRRVGRRYYVQTPNRWFPIEPHFLVPGFQFLPISLRVALVRRFRLGWMARVPDADAARAVVESIQLLTADELQRLFPEGTLHREQLGGLTKSLIVTHGF
jgi:hypothetical protein